MQSDKADSPAPESAGTRLAAKRAAKAAKKAASRGTSNPVEDAANSVAHEATAWIDRHGRTVLIVLGAGVLIAVGSLVIGNLSQGKNREAGVLLQTAIGTAQGIVVPADETAPEDPIFPVFPSVKEREEKALGQFREVSKKFPDTRAAAYAQLGEEREAVVYPASYVSLFYPSAMMGRDVQRIEGVPVEWIVPANARASRFIQKLNINAVTLNADGTLTETQQWAYPGAPHPEDKGQPALTREERLTLIRAVDLGGQYYSRRNAPGGAYAGMDYQTP